MKKILTTFILCIAVFISTARPGDDDDGKIKMPNGFRFGYQRSNLAKINGSSFEPVNYGYVGFLRKIRLIPFIHLETGLEFMVAGAEPTSNSHYRLSYLTLPLQGVLKLGPFVALAGLNGNFKVGEKLLENDNSVSIPKENKGATFDLAGDVGLGFNILIVTIEARYYWGLLDVKNDYFNRYAQLGLKIHF